MFTPWFVNIYGYIILIIYWAGLLKQKMIKNKLGIYKVKHIQKKLLQKQILQKCYFFYHF